jgi:Ca2+-binding EF-hand superfamily protein
MKEISRNRRITRVAIPLACATLIGACASYDHRETAYSTSGAANNTPTALFDRLDTNRDGFLSRGEVEPLGLVSAAAPVETAAAAFDRLDTNRDGFLSPGEAGNIFAPIPGGSFSAFDANRDGFLSRAEAMPQLQWLETRQTRVGPSFDAFDTNRDGFLSRAEAEPLLAATRISGDRYVVGPIAGMSFDRLDVDRDGFLSRSEAAAVMSAGIFERYDSNRDGFLSRSEAESMFGNAVGATR